MIKAIIFDFNDVVYVGNYDQNLLNFISELKQKYKIGLISNYSQAGYEKYVVPVKEYFDDVVISSQVGVAKPDPKIYELTAKRLGLKPAECIYIDNHSFRVDGAEKAGMHGITYENFDQMKKDLGKLLSANPDN